MKRKLASIQVIDKLSPIPGADRIVEATVMGWKVIVKKDEFVEGDKCVFFEVDSLLPEVEWAEFMRTRKFRVKTLKMRGILSQGLVLPLDILPKPNMIRRMWNKITGKDSWNVDDDVTKILGVKKYDVEAQCGGFDSGLQAAPFPSFIPKTDEIRLQSCLSLLHELKGNAFYITVKCDGTSGTFYKKDGELFVCSRNRTVKPGDNVYYEMANKYDLANRLPEGVAIQGEVCGPGIQKNRLGLKEKDLFVFDVFDIKTGRYYDFPSMTKFCLDHTLTTVPIDSVILDYEDWALDLNTWLEKAKGLYEGSTTRREGIVVRPVSLIRSNRLHGSRLSFKVINNDYLLKDED